MNVAYIMCDVRSLEDVCPLLREYVSMAISPFKNVLIPIPPGESLGYRPLFLNLSLLLVLIINDVGISAIRWDK